MGRWEPNARGRLQAAALELYGERGFEQTTVAEIAERAGLTERTFFRHFADKREVLFDAADRLKELLIATVAEVPPDATPQKAVASGLDAVAAMLEERREFAERRQLVIAANSELQERELIKYASLATALADVLRRRGVLEPEPRLIAEVAMAVLRAAFERWIEDPTSAPLQVVIRQALDQLGAFLSTTTHDLGSASPRVQQRSGSGRHPLAPSPAGGDRC